MVLFWSCCPKKNKSIIYGEIKHAEGKNITLEVLSPGNIKTVKTVTIEKDGSFEITCDSINNSFHRLKIDDQNIIYLRINEGDKIEINADYPEISRNYTVRGSDDCALLLQMNKRLLSSSDRLNELKENVNKYKLIPDYNIDSLWKNTNEEARALYDSDKKYLIDLIKANPKSPVIYMALYQYIGISPILMIENDLEIFEYVLKELKANNPQLEQTALLESEISKYKLLLTQRTNDYISLSPGTKAPDFVLPDISSKKISLSSFVGEKVILCYWASWSKTSINSILKLSETVKKSEIKLVLISLDTGAESWKAAIKNNQMESFVNLCDLKTWESPVIKIYGIKTLPTFVLIDEKTNIEIITEDLSDLINDIKTNN